MRSIGFLTELKPALSTAPIIRALQFIITNTAATRCCWVISGVDHHVVNVASLARIWSDHHVVNVAAARTNGTESTYLQRRMTVMMRLLRKCGAREHCEDAKRS